MWPEVVSSQELWSAAQEGLEQHHYQADLVVPVKVVRLIARARKQLNLPVQAWEH